jgi:hypothetical protein
MGVWIRRPTGQGLPDGSVVVTRGLLKVEAVKARCIVDAATHCWLWQGAASTEGTPRIYTFDHERGEKRTMSGPRAMWNIAHQEAPPSWAPLVFRCCGKAACVNPAHLRTARDKAEIGLHIRRSGHRVGTALESRQASQRLAMAAQGITPTAPDVVRAIRAANPAETSVALAARHHMAVQTVSRIRRGESHKGIT